jgi:hypothetical protein
MLGAPGEDGVFRYTPSPDDGQRVRPEDDEESVKGWFDTAGDPEIAAQVAAATAAARQEVPALGEVAPKAVGAAPGGGPQGLPAGVPVPGTDDLTPPNGVARTDGT